MADATVGFLSRPVYRAGTPVTGPGVNRARDRRIHFMYVGTYSGAGKIVGQVQLHGVGYQAFYVLAPLENPAVVLSSGATDGFGNFSVEGIDARKRYIVYAVDQPGSYNMRGWSHVTPVLV